MKPDEIQSTANAIKELFPASWAVDKGWTLQIAYAFDLITAQELMILRAFLTSL